MFIALMTMEQAMDRQMRDWAHMQKAQYIQFVFSSAKPTENV